VNYNHKEQVLTSQTSLAKDLDPLVDLGADLFIGLMIYF